MTSCTSVARRKPSTVNLLLSQGGADTHLKSPHCCYFRRWAPVLAALLRFQGYCLPPAFHTAAR